MSAEPRYSRLRLVIPSIAQGNARGRKGGSDWCGRTSSAMIHNYFTANRGGGVAATVSRLIVNQREQAPFDLVFADTKAVAVDGYLLAATVRRAKASYRLHSSAPGSDAPSLWPMGARSGVPSPAMQLEILAPVLRALEAFNPVLFYSGLSSNPDQSRHVVVISGYRWARGELWLHIDDPSSRYAEEKGRPAPWSLCRSLVEPTRALEQQLVQLPADSGTEAPARRYLLRASRLFEPNLNSRRTDDCWCDHSDAPGFTVLLSHEPEGERALVECDSGEPGLPLELASSSVSRLAGLGVAREQARNAGAPFPLGTNRGWHDGIHLVAEEETAVRPVACGTLLTARMPATGSDGRDHGALVMRHDFDPRTSTVVASGEPVPDGAIAFYTMLVHLAGGEAGTAAIRERLAPGDEPERTLMPGTSLQLVAHDEAGIVHVLGDGIPATREHPRSQGVALAVEGAGELVALLVDETDAPAWNGKPPAPPVAPAGARHVLRDATTGTLYPIEGTPRPRIELAVDATSWELVVRDEQDDNRWCPWQRPQQVRIDGSTMMCSHGKAERAAMGQGATAVVRGPGTVLAETDAGTLRMIVEWPGKPEVLPCNDDGTVALELVARIEKRHRPTIERALKAGTAPRVLASLELVVDARRFAVRVPRWVELERDGDAIVIVDGSTPAVTRARVRTASIRVVPRSRQCCQHDADDGAALAAMDEDAPVLSLSTTETLRARIGTDGRACALQVDELRAYGDPSSPYDARVRLEPCVGLDETQWQTVADAHAQRRSTAHGDVHLRLGARMSRLAAVRIDAKGGWQREGSVVQPRAAGTPELWLDLVAGKQSWRVDADARRDHAAVPAELRLPLLGSFVAGKRQYAIVEVRFAARDDDFTEALIRRWRTRVSLRDRVVAALLEGPWVDFAAIERELATADDPAAALAGWRSFARDPIAEAGWVEPDRRGVHVQLFSVDPLLPDDPARGRWHECGADVQGAPLSRAFFEAAVRSVLASDAGRDGETPPPQVTAVLRALDRDGITPARWRELCRDPEVDRLLARRVAVHESEWTIDWASAAREAARDGVAIDPALAAWPDDPAALGLPTGTLRFHHPLRVLEWLATGLEITVASKSCDAATLVLPGGAEIELSPRKRSDGYAAGTRLLLGELRTAPIRAALRVPGHTEGDAPLPIELARAEVTRLWIAQPDVTLTPAAIDRGCELALPVRRGDPEPDPTVTHLFADGGARLDRAWESRASVTVTVTWNLHPPTSLTIALDGQGFVFDGAPRASSPSATITPQGKGFTVAITHDDAAIFTGPRTLQLELSVRAGDQLDARAELTVEAAGGDLSQSVRRVHRLQTRALAEGQRGRDVAKLQLMLSQLLALGEPCLLPSGKDRTAAIDGGYDGQTALALWTFVLAFAGRSGWTARQLTATRGTVPTREPLWLRPAGARDDEAWPLVCNAADAAHREHGSLTVDAPLVAELVRCFALPHVVPLVDFAIAAPRLSGALAAQASALGPEATRLLPAPGLDPANVVKLTVALRPGFDRAHAEQVTVDVDDGGGDYVVADGRTRRTLAELLRDGLELAPSGSIGSAAERNRIALAVEGHAIGSIALAGTRSLHTLARGRGLDVLLVQRWLTAQHDTGGAPLLAAVDGQWGKPSAAALHRFVELRGISSDYDDELRDLATGIALPLAAEACAP